MAEGETSVTRASGAVESRCASREALRRLALHSSKAAWSARVQETG
jgi:hypothetical protein